MGRNSKGSGTIRQRDNGTWEARITVGVDGRTGKQKRKSLSGKTKKETYGSC